MKYDKGQRLYSYGLPITEKLHENIIDQKIRINNNKASMILIDGGVGEGKTTLGIHILEAYQDNRIDYKRQYSMGGDDFQVKLKLCYDSKLPVIIYDESGDFSKRAALTGFNKQLNRIFDTYRVFKILVILILPNFDKLENDLFDKQIPRLLLHCERRTECQGNFKAYSLNRMYYIKHYMKKYVVKPQAYSKVHPNFHGHFQNLSPTRSAELDAITKKGKLNIVSESILDNQGLVSVYQIAKKIGRTDRWIRGKLSKLKLKPQQKYKKKNYYDKGVIEILLNQTVNR